MSTWAFAVIMALLSTPLPPVRYIVMQQGHVEAIAQAAARTRNSNLEESFCLVGIARQNGVYFIGGVVRPQQKAWIEERWDGVYSLVMSGRCPVGTIVDMHTHPFHPRASILDHALWRTDEQVRVHLIAYLERPDRLIFQANDYTEPSQPRVLVGGWLITQPRGTP